MERWRLRVADLFCRDCRKQRRLGEGNFLLVHPANVRQLECDPIVKASRTIIMPSVHTHRWPWQSFAPLQGEEEK